jgi:hypothetical protein
MLDARHPRSGLTAESGDGPCGTLVAPVHANVAVRPSRTTQQSTSETYQAECQPFSTNNGTYSARTRRSSSSVT